MNGGYLIVSLQNHDFVVDGGKVYVKDIYKTIANSNYKAVMLCDITLNGERKQNVYSVIERRENTIILYAYGNAITITDTDTIEITGNIVTNIRYYDSLEAAMAANLPDGSFVAVPSEESAGGGGLPFVEITTEINLEAPTPLSEADNQALDVALEKGLPIVCKLNMGGYMANIAALVQTEQGTAYLINIGNGISVNITKIDSGWSVMVQYEG